MWVPESADQQTVRREDLPTSLFPVRTVPLREHNPDELRKLAERPQKILPVPEVEDPGLQRRLANLAQYKGRSVEGQERALGNMPRKVKSERIEVSDMSTSISVPTASPAFTKVEDTFRGRMKRRVLSKDEFDLYVHTWNEFMKAHPEWDQPEDHDDLHTICMETVLMFRCEEYVMRNPGKNKSDDYDAAFARKEKARANLTARRVDRVGTKAKGNHTTNNIAVLAGQVTDAQIQERQRKMEEKRLEESRFLEAPSKGIADLSGIIDAEVVSAAEDVDNPAK